MQSKYQSSNLWLVLLIFLLKRKLKIFSFPEDFMIFFSIPLKVSLFQFKIQWELIFFVRQKGGVKFVFFLHGCLIIPASFIEDHLFLVALQFTFVICQQRFHISIYLFQNLNFVPLVYFFPFCQHCTVLLIATL